MAATAAAVAAAAAAMGAWRSQREGCRRCLATSHVLQTITLPYDVNTAPSSSGASQTAGAGDDALW
eukprot:scaffold865_cov312-Prasinococcus_capsulatus_cf.AAC.19